MIISGKTPEASENKTMKKFLLMIFCLGMAVNVFSQSKTITEEEYRLMEKATHEKMSKIPRREITVTKTYVKKQLVKTRTLTQEYLPPERSRWEFITKENGAMTERLQIIYIGDSEYRKEGDNPWKAKDPNKPNVGGGDRRGKEIENMKQYIVFNSTLDNKPVTLYSYYRVYNWGKTLNFFDLRIWVDSEELIVKTESTSSDIFPDNVTSSISSTYEYNPKGIKPIEAPIK